ncbi:ABC transporter permease [Lichenifustis flavocetrariae]|uniref:Autoinducer 2 import system permease protein LsrD n=1 Tax=Lichenifustis flavocetrariae TaxID=2949735 RepID=A0AA41YYI8_9HYPH|nr:ABC transporter permease [Lichenifustis flavocetrariae]MCW6510941.1 ABC transporter permease [Lichenifustis flavocetrariae]
MSTMSASAVAHRGLYRAVQLRRNKGIGGLTIVVLLFLAAYAVLFPGLLTFEGFAKFSQTWLPLALTAMAQAMLMLAGGISLSVGATVSLGAVVAATTMGTPLGVAGGLGAVVLVGLVVGAITGAITVRLRLPAIIVTLAGSFIIGGVALLILPRPGGSVPTTVSDLLAGTSPVAFGLLLATIALWKLYAATPLGLGLYAAGENPVGAYRSGVAVDTVLIAAYAISGALTALAGFFVAAQTGSGDPVIGSAFTLNSIAAAVLGGVGFGGGQGTMRGAFLGSLLLTVMINVMFFLGLPPVAQYIAQGLIIVGAVALPEIAKRRAHRAGRVQS